MKQDIYLGFGGSTDYTFEDNLKTVNPTVDLHNSPTVVLHGIPKAVE